MEIVSTAPAIFSLLQIRGFIYEWRMGMCRNRQTKIHMFPHAAVIKWHGAHRLSIKKLKLECWCVLQLHSFMRNYPCYLEMSCETHCYFYIQLRTHAHTYSHMMAYIWQRWSDMHEFTDMHKNEFLCLFLACMHGRTHARTHANTLTHTDKRKITHTPPCSVSSTDSSNEFLLCVSQLAPTQGNFSG